MAIAFKILGQRSDALFEPASAIYFLKRHTAVPVGSIHSVLSELFLQRYGRAGRFQCLHFDLLMHTAMFHMHIPNCVCRAALSPSPARMIREALEENVDEAG